MSDYAYGSVRLCALEQAQETREEAQHGMAAVLSEQIMVPNLGATPIPLVNQAEAHEKSEALDV